METLADSVISFVRQCVEGLDAAHDLDHCSRIAHLASKIAVAEGVSKENALLAGMLHDVADWKYNSDSEAQEVYGRCAEMLRTLPQLSEDDVEDVMWAIQRVGFHNTLDGGAAEEEGGPDGASLQRKQLLLACVQDADLLDALGSIGIARCFTYGGSKGRRLFPTTEEGICGPPATKEEYASRKHTNNSTLQHFFDKLLLLKDKMRTNTGRTMATRRHMTMVRFLEELAEEVADAGVPGLREQLVENLKQHQNQEL